MISTYARAYREVNLILKLISPQYYSKIPPQIITKIQSEMDTTYNPDVENIIWMEETKAILYNIFKDYLATPEQRKTILKKEYLEKQLIEEEKSKRYNPKIFSYNESIVNSTLNNNTISNEPKLVSEIQTHKPDNGGITSNTQTMVPYKKASIIQKIILKIKKKIGRKK